MDDTRGESTEVTLNKNDYQFLCDPWIALNEVSDKKQLWYGYEGDLNLCICVM